LAASLSGKMNQVTVIENLAFGGFGVGSFEGVKLFIPYTIPGERLSFRIVQSRRRYAWAEVVEVLDPSPGRTHPPCPYFGRCGGCQWQHMEDSLQVFWKEGVFRDVLFRIGAIKGDRIKPLIPSPEFYGYRNRVTLKIKEETLGFLSERSHNLVRIDHCLLAFSQINEVLADLQGKLSFLPPGELEMAASPYESGIMIWARFETEIGDKNRERLKEIVRGVGLIKWLSLSASGETREISLSSGPEKERGLAFRLEPSVLKPVPLNLIFFPGVFIQVNWKQNERLLESLLNTVNGLGKGLRILELYAGAGNFTAPLAASGHSVVAVEQSKRAVVNARFNLARNNLDGVTLIRRSAERALQEMEARREEFQVLVADPPRAGLKREISTLIRLKVPYLLYISCDPATLGRDLKVLVNAGYDVEYVQPLDFFPQTYHVESITFLRSA
jgi:23S rRNA (uracil1939-C5)-methyltransferase